MSLRRNDSSTAFFSHWLTFHLPLASRSAGVPWRQLPLDPEHQVIKGLTADPDVIFVVRDDVSNRAASLHRYSISHNEYGPSLLDDPEYAMTGCKLMMTEDRK